MTRILICDDHELVRTAIARVLASHPELHIVGQAAQGPELLTLLSADAEAAEVLLLDLNTDGGGVAAGLSLLERVCRQHPTLLVVVLSMHAEPEVVDRALRAGARGFVAKGSSMDTLVQAVSMVRRGRRYVDPALVDGLILRRDQTEGLWDATLTPREREVMARLCAGERLTQIAEALGVSVKTVSTHKMRLMEKLRVGNNAELIRLGHAHGLR